MKKLMKIGFGAVLMAGAALGASAAVATPAEAGVTLSFGLGAPGYYGGYYGPAYYPGYSYSYGPAYYPAYRYRYGPTFYYNSGWGGRGHWRGYRGRGHGYGYGYHRR